MGWFDFLFGRSNKGRDGTCAEKAIIVNSIAEEYQWVRTNCPGFTPHMQSLKTIDGRPYDVLTLRSESGEERIVYFEISSFFGH